MSALAAIAGSWDESEAIQALVDAQKPTLLLAGTADFLNSGYPSALWPTRFRKSHGACAASATLAT